MPAHQEAVHEDLGREFRGDLAWYIGSFIVWKGATKYIAFRGGFMIATARGNEFTGEDIVHWPDPVTQPLDDLISSLTSLLLNTDVDISPTESTWLPFGYFFGHIHEISTPLAVAELVGFTLIGSLLRRYGSKCNGNSDWLYKHTGI